MYHSEESRYSSLDLYGKPSPPSHFLSLVGHFTQVVWDKSDKLGVGTAKDKEGNIKVRLPCMNRILVKFFDVKSWCYAIPRLAMSWASIPKTSSIPETKAARGSNERKKRVANKIEFILAIFLFSN